MFDEVHAIIGDREQGSQQGMATHTSTKAKGENPREAVYYLSSKIYDNALYCWLLHND